MLRFSLSLIYIACSSLLLAQEPAANPTTMQFINPKTYGFSLSFTPSAAQGFLVLKSESPISFVPTDGVAYQKGQGVAQGVKVVSANSNYFFNIREVLENTSYFFRVYAFNGSGTTVNYKQTDPLEGNITTPASDPGSYYNSVDSSAYNLLAQLRGLLYPHTAVSYSAYRTLILPVMYERDTINNSAAVDCEYSNTTTTYLPPFDFVAHQYNREHALPKSWMLTGGNTANPDGSDYHNLLLTLAQPNQARSNHPLGIVLNTTTTFGEAKIGTDALGNTVFQPKENRRGDAARSMFYQMVTYNGDGGNWGFDNLLTEAELQDQNTLKLWHNQDPPDKFERTKTDYIFSLQGNRNPFIDHPGWVNCINFDSLVKTNFCGAISALDDSNPLSDMALHLSNHSSSVEVSVTCSNFFTASYAVTDLFGRIVSENKVALEPGLNRFSMKLDDVAPGLYFFAIYANGRISAAKFVR